MGLVNKIVFGLCTLLPATVVAQAAEQAPEGLEELLPAALEAAQGGKWGIFAALLIMVLVHFVTKVKFVKNLLPKEAKPWVAAIAGVVASIVTTVLTTGDWVQAILGGLVTGSAAVGLWEMLGRKLSGKNKKKSEDSQ